PRGSKSPLPMRAVPGYRKPVGRRAATRPPGPPARSRSMSDRPDDSVALEEPIVATKSAPRSRTRTETQTRRQPPYHVVILNDEEHTFDYVIELLTKLFAHPLATAKDLTWRIHTTGRAVVFTTHRELAELKRD